MLSKHFVDGPTSSISQSDAGLAEIIQNAQPYLTYSAKLPWTANKTAGSISNSKPASKEKTIFLETPLSN